MKKRSDVGLKRDRSVDFQAHWVQLVLYGIYDFDRDMILGVLGAG